MFQYSSLAEKPFDQWEIATHWRPHHCDPHLDQTKFNDLLPLTIDGVQHKYNKCLRVVNIPNFHSFEVLQYIGFMWKCWYSWNSFWNMMPGEILFISAWSMVMVFEICNILQLCNSVSWSDFDVFVFVFDINVFEISCLLQLCWMRLKVWRRCSVTEADFRSGQALFAVVIMLNKYFWS